MADLLAILSVYINVGVLDAQIFWLIQKGPWGHCGGSSKEKEDAMWIVYLVVGVVVIMFVVLSFIGLEQEA